MADKQFPFKLDPQLLLHLIRNRRTIKPAQFDKSRPVEKHIIEEMLEAARWAPTHGMTEPWRFTVFSGDGLKTLGQFQSKLYKKITDPDKYNKKKKKDLKEKPLLASHIISIGMKRQKKGKIPEVEEIEAVACAVQNMTLVATAYGVGTYWGSGGITYENEAKPFFKLQPEDRLLGFLYIGYPDIKWPSCKRESLKDKVRWEE